MTRHNLCKPFEAAGASPRPTRFVRTMTFCRSCSGGLRDVGPYRMVSCQLVYLSPQKREEQVPPLPDMCEQQHPKQREHVDRTKPKRAVNRDRTLCARRT